MKSLHYFLFILFLYFFSCLNICAQFKIDDYKAPKKVEVKRKAESDISTFADGLILRTVTDRTSYYENGLVCVKWELLYPNLPNLNIDYKVNSFHIPKLPDFVLEQTLNPTEKDSLKVYRTSLNGKSYMAKTLLCFYITPLMFHGTATIDEGDITLQLYNHSGGYIGLPKKLISKSVSFSVTDLKGKPDNYSNGIGQFSIESKMLPNANLFVGQSSTLRVIIKGSGNFKQLTAPKVVLPDSFECYPLESKFNVNYDYSSCSGSCVFDYVVIPHKVSSYVIPPIKFVFYNLNQKRFVEISSHPIHVNVHPKIAHKNEQLVEKHEAPSNHQYKNEQPSFLIYLLFAGCIITLLIVYFFYRRRSHRKSKSTVDTFLIAENSLSELYNTNDLSFVYNQSAKILKDYFSDVYGEKLLTDSYTDFSNKCADCGLSDSLIKSLYDFLKESNDYCYSPNPDSNKTVFSIIDYAKALLAQLKHS